MNQETHQLREEEKENTIMTNAIVQKLFILSMLAIPGSLTAAVYQASSPEPTPEETLILEYMNRFRADPAADAKRMMPGGGNKVSRWIKVDWKMFESEMKALKSAPPLVFNLQLLEAARKHSYYMTKNGLGHTESSGKDGYTGKSFGSRCKAAGYKGGASGENCYAAAGNAWASHTGFVIDFGAGGTGGMQPGRGHRKNMISARTREVGPGAVPNGKALSVTHNFGRSRSARLVGGVIFVDSNKNGFYDIGEGRGGIKISASDGSQTKTWKSGAYTLALTSTKALVLKASLGDQNTTKSIQAGKTNIKFDWIVPKAAEIKIADQLLAKVEAISPADASNKNFFKAAVALYLGTEGIALDAGRQKRIATLTKDVAPKMRTSQKSITEALSNFDPSTWKKTMSEAKKPFSGTVAEAWFKEADMVGTAKASTKNFESQMQNGKVRSNLQRSFVKHLESLSKQLNVPVFRSEVDVLLSRVKALTEPKRPNGRRAKGRKRG